MKIFQVLKEQKQQNSQENSEDEEENLEEISNFDEDSPFPPGEGAAEDSADFDQPETSGNFDQPETSGILFGKRNRKKSQRILTEEKILEKIRNRKMAQKEASDGAAAERVRRQAEQRNEIERLRKQKKATRDKERRQRIAAAKKSGAVAPLEDERPSGSDDEENEDSGGGGSASRSTSPEKKKWKNSKAPLPPMPKLQPRPAFLTNPALPPISASSQQKSTATAPIAAAIVDLRTAQVAPSPPSQYATHFIPLSSLVPGPRPLPPLRPLGIRPRTPAILKRSSAAAPSMAPPPHAAKPAPTQTWSNPAPPQLLRAMPPVSQKYILRNFE